MVPKELQGRGAVNSGSHIYQLPRAAALEQLSRGAVKVPLGELRRVAPPGTFAAGTGSENRLIDLPLREILNQIRPEAFARRSDQQLVSVPDDLTDLFGSKGERLTTVRVLDKNQAKAAPAQPVPQAPAITPGHTFTSPVPRVAQTPQPEPIRIAAPNLARQMATAAQTPSAAPTIPAPSVPPLAKPAPTQVAPVARVPVQTPLPTGPSISAVPRPQPVAPQKPAPAPPTTLPPNAIKLPTAPAVAPVQPAPAASPFVATPFPGTNEARISVSLAKVCQKWPAQVRSQIQQLGATDIELPINVIESALKLGKVEFPLKQVVIWLRPEPEVEVSLEHAETILEFPLPVIAPLFLEQRSLRGAKKSNVPSGIPDLFNARGEKLEQAEAEPEAEAAAPAPEPPAPPAPAPVASDRPRPQNLCELFNEPNKKNWTPNEIVHKTITLPGVTGALIALQDGLLVAGCMPPPWKAETIAAFIPQIFGRLTQYTKELQMGEVQSVSFAVETGTLQIFNAGIIYFAALGKPDTGLPISDLCLISTELGRHTK